MLKHSLLFFSLFILLFSGTEPVKRSFTYRILQDGVEVPVKKNSVSLHKKAFVIEFTIPGPLAIFVNASLDDRSFRIAKTKKPYTTIPGFTETGMAESNFNSEREIMMNDAAPNYWFYDNENQHRFDNVKAGNNGFICTRTVEKLYDVNQKKTIKLEQMTGPLYLVFLVKQAGKSQEDEKQLQRECLKIKWE
ncbi:MAG TPA: hypothetical protein VI112_13690 [Bacteroidia bacterium]|jgi:hypothetical protein